MALQEQELLIVTLAKMLAKRRQGADTLCSALSLLCRGFAFDYAFLYEADWNRNLLHLIENVGFPERSKTAPESLSLDLYENIEQETVVYWDRRLQSTQEQQRAMSLFGTQSVAAFMLADENGRIYCLLALCCAGDRLLLDGPARENLETALNILSKNATIRTCQNRFQFAQTALEGVLDHTGIDIYVNDFYNHDILYVNESMAKPYGGKKRFTGEKCWQVLFPGRTGPCEFCPQKELIDEAGNPTKVYTWDYQRAFDGSWFRVFSAAFRWADGRLAHVVSSADITDNKRNEELIRYMADYDALTNLPNRRKLVSECERLISQGMGKLEYVLFFDIDGFKNINDSLGHDAGDEFLVQLGRFFTGIPLLKDVTYRNGGDEFVAILGEGITAAHVCDLSRFIHSRFDRTWELKNGSVTCGISIGVSRYPKDGMTAEELLRKADQAMYCVKRNGGGGLCFADGCE